MLIVKNFNRHLLFYHIGKFTSVLSRFHDMIVNPVIVAAAWFSAQNAVVFEAVFIEPVDGDLF